MPQVIKFPDMRPPSRGGPVRELPGPAHYRQMTPAVLAADGGASKPRVERKRRFVWFGVALGLHAALFIGIWLSPPLRLKWSPSPDAWVPVVSLPGKPPESAPAPARELPAPGAAMIKQSKRTVGKPKAREVQSPIESLPEKAK